MVSLDVAEDCCSARRCQGTTCCKSNGGKQLSFVKLSTTARFLPSLRDLFPASTLVPGLKAWAIFGSPSGTLPNSEIRPMRQLRPSSTTRPSREESCGPAHVIAISLSEGLTHHLFFARCAKKIHQGEPE